jgi:zinc/manganese transport system permease protein
MTADGLDIGILGPGFLAGLLVTATHVPLGRQVLARGIIFIDLAIAQIAALGVLLAHAWSIEQGTAGVQATAFGAAVLGAAALYFCERRWPEILEALIGTSFVLAATGSILILANDPQGGEHLRELLVGQILWVGYGQLWSIALLYALVLVVWFAASGARRPALFYPLFSLAVTASVQLVGVYLVFASLIIPALAVRRQPRRALALGYAVSLLGYAGGLLASAVLDLPAGAVIVWMLALCALILSLGTRAAAQRSRP